MKVPFTLAQFLDVFRNYNLAVWPMQIGLYILAFAAVLFAIRKNTLSDKAISTILSFLWIWMGIAYHLVHFTSINKAAYAFGAMFIVQGSLLAYFGIVKGKIQFEYKPDIYGIAGLILISYALLVYPLLGHLQGRSYPSTPTFGLPCPTTIFTFGLLLWTKNKFPAGLLIIPLAWSVTGTSAAVKFGIREDIGLLLSGLICALLIWRRNTSVSKIAG